MYTVQCVTFHKSRGKTAHPGGGKVHPACAPPNEAMSAKIQCVINTTKGVVKVEESS